MYSLPYPSDKLEYIQKNGATVDMSALNFPGIPKEKQIRVALVYLRNTDFNNIILDFSGCSYEEKSKYLLLYLTDNIECKNVLLAQSWSKILNYCTGLNTEVPCILSDVEIETFINENLQVLKEALELLISLPVFLIKRYKNKENKTLNLDSLEKTSEKPIGVNLIHLLNIPGISLIYTKEYELSPKNYTEIFTIDNEALFNKLLETDFGILFLCLTTSKVDEIKELINNLSAFEKEL